MSHCLLTLAHLQTSFPIFSKVLLSSILLGLSSTLSAIAIAKASIASSVAQSQLAEVTNSIDKKLLGLWQAKILSLGLAKLTLIFTPDGKLFLFLPSTSGASIGYEARYRINQSSQPMQIDVSSPGDEQTSREIFEFTADGKLRVEITNPGRPRPTAFTRKAVLFEKISEATTLPANTQLLKPDLAEDRARQSEGKLYIGSLNRAQQAYFLENNKFAITIEQLGIGIKPETENYRYQIVSQPNRPQSVMMTATAKHPELRSYTGAVFVINDRGESTTIQGTCETDGPSLTPPAMPIPPSNSEGRVQCPPASHPLLRGLHE